MIYKFYTASFPEAKAQASKTVRNSSSNRECKKGSKQAEVEPRTNRKQETQIKPQSDISSNIRSTSKSKNCKTSTSRQTISTNAGHSTSKNSLRQRSNSIKQHLCSIDSKRSYESKPRQHMKPRPNPQVSVERNSLTKARNMGSGFGYAREGNLTITTPDKDLSITNSLYKNSSSKKKSAVKKFKPTDIKQ